MSDKIEYLHNRNVHFHKRTLWMTGVIDRKMYEEVSKNLAVLDKANSIISIKLFSEGGDLAACRAIYSSIVECQSDVTITVYGEACSSASVILQAADERIMMPESDLMIHLGEEGYPAEHPRNIDALITHNRRMEKWMKNIYLERIKQRKPKYTMQKLSDLMRFDKYITAKQALDLGLIDYIGGMF